MSKCKFCGSSQGRLTLSLPEKINLLRFWQKFHHKMIAFHGFQILQKKIIFFVLFLRYTYGGKEKIALQIFQHCTFLNFFCIF